MPGEVTALLSSFGYALSYIFLHRAQRRGETCDAGLLPLLTISSAILLAASAVRFIFQPSTFQPGPGWRSSILFCALSGLVGTFLGRLTLYEAIARIGATRSVVIKSLSPIVTIMASLLLFRDVPKADDLVGFSLMFASVLLLVAERKWLDQRSYLRSIVSRGILLGAGAALFQGTGHIMRKLGMTSSANPLLGASVDMITALGLYILWLTATGRLRSYVRFYWSRRSMDLLAAGVLSTLGVLLFFTASVSAPIATISVISAMQPIFTTVLSGLLFPGLEQFTWLTYVYTALVVIGVSFVITDPALF